MHLGTRAEVYPPSAAPEATRAPRYALFSSEVTQFARSRRMAGRHGLINSFNMPGGARGSMPASADLIGIFGDHFSQSLLGSAASVKRASAGATGASGPSSGVAKATPPVTSDSSEVFLSWAPPK